MPEQQDEPRWSRAIPLLTLAAILLLILAGWWLFPRAQRSLAFQDCVATGRPNCAGVH